jgi:hypothetical protein
MRGNAEVLWIVNSKSLSEFANKLSGTRDEPDLAEVLDTANNWQA